MKQIYQYIILLSLLSACQKGQKQQVGLVQYYGVLREIMMEQKTDASVDLSGLSEPSNLYGLGALEGLSGELLILNGQAFKSTVSENGDLVLDTNFSDGATLLVTAQVEEWIELPLTKVIQSLGDLEVEVKALAQQNGVDINKPFPFMLTGNMAYVKSHVINAPGASERTHEAFKASGVTADFRGKEATILGFYSEQHQGIFTHHGSFIHAHVLAGEKPGAAHVDELVLHPGVLIKLPKTW